MSTPCTVTFERSGGRIYKHWDGYPEEMLPLLKRFLDTVEAETKDTRFSDASYLAAKFVVFLANEYRREGAAQMDFLSVGILPSEGEFGAGDFGEHFSYHVDCELLNRKTGRPTIRYAPVD